MENTSQKWCDIPDLPGEEWRPVKGHEGRYSISNKGRVMSHINRIYYKSLLKQKVTAAGYIFVHLSTGKAAPRMQCVGVSRLVAMAFIPNPDPNHFTEVDHIDDDKANNCVENLQWISHDSNVRKSQGYRWTLYHVDSPEDKFEFSSRRQAELFLTGILKRKDRINITYTATIRRGKPNRYGWVVTCDKLTMEERLVFPVQKIENK